MAETQTQAQTIPQTGSQQIYDIAIIGAGVVGLATSMYAARLNLKSIVFGTSLDHELPIGGVITLTEIVENYPGFTKLTGTELAMKMKEHALDYPEHVTLKDAKVESITKSGDHFEVVAEGTRYEARTIIFATGARWRKLPMKGAKEYENKGVHYCALCDGPLYPGKKVAVIGGGDTAAKEALLLSQMAEAVYIIYRGEKLRPEPINGQRVASTPNIHVLTNTNVIEIKGGPFVESVELDNHHLGGTSLEVDAVFGAIGHIPNSDLAGSLGVALNEKGEIVIDRTASTNIPGIFAAGDVGDLHFKQAITGVAEGVIAAYSAFQYIAERDRTISE